jgi:predicted transcriptional regulator
MIHIDPASTEFESLPRQEQAVILHSMGWDIPSLMDEYGMTRETIRRWIDPEYKARRDASHSAYRKTPHGRALAYKHAKLRRLAQKEAA